MVMNFTTKTLLIFGSVCIILILIVSIWVVLIIQKETVELLNVKNDDIHQFADLIENKFSYASQIISFSSTIPEIRNIAFVDQIDERIRGIPENSDIPKRKFAQSFLETFKDFLVARFTLINGDTYMMEPYDRQLALSVFNAKETKLGWFAGVTKLQDLYVSEAYVGLAVKKKTVNIAHPVYSENNELIGFWSAALDLQFLEDQIRHMKQKDVRIIVFDHKKNIVVDTNGDIPSYLLESSSLRNSLSGNSGIQIENNNGVKEFVSYHKIRVGPHIWGVLKIQPYAEAFSSIDAIKSGYYTILLISISIIAVGGFVFHKTLKIAGRNVVDAQNEKELLQKISSASSRIEKLKEMLILQGANGYTHNRMGFSKNQYLIAITFFVASTVLLGSFVVTHGDITQTLVTQKTTLSSKFVIQNVRGDTIDTWMRWELPMGEKIHIAYANPDLLSDERLKVVEGAIFSENKFEIEDSLLNKGLKGASTYYEGWVGAVKEVSKKRTKYYLPTEYDISTSKVGDIIIEFTKNKNADGYAAYTKNIVDEHQILKSTITVYDIDSLSDKQLSDVIRHEFGHSLGLAHSTAPEDLMAPIIPDIAYISDCDMDAVQYLYDGNQMSSVTCEK
jgi:hypothetical protein